MSTFIGSFSLRPKDKHTDHKKRLFHVEDYTQKHRWVSDIKASLLIKIIAWIFNRPSFTERIENIIYEQKKKKSKQFLVSPYLVKFKLKGEKTSNSLSI